MSENATGQHGFRKIFNTMQSGLQSGLQSIQKQGSYTYPTTLHAQSSLKCGWLKKQGGVVKSWHRRWFALKGDMLYYFNSEDESKGPIGHIFLPGNKVVQLPYSPTEVDRFMFEIAPGGEKERMTVNHESYQLCADSEDDLKDWIRVIRRVMFSQLGGAIFGQSLEETVCYENKTGTARVPEIVQMCITFLRSKGLEVEGIFRLPGRTSVVRELKEAFDSGARPRLVLSEVDVHSVASLLKLYLRELPEPLIPFQFYESVIKIVTRDMHGSPDKALERLSILLTKIPRANYNLLKYLCRFLYDVSAMSDVNRMTAMNLATVFSHGFIRPEDDDPALLMGTSSGRAQVTFILISRYQEVLKMEYTRDGSTVVVDDLLDLGCGSPKPELISPQNFDGSCKRSGRIIQMFDCELDDDSDSERLPLPLQPLPKEDDNESGNSCDVSPRAGSIYDEVADDSEQSDSAENAYSRSNLSRSSSFEKQSSLIQTKTSIEDHNLTEEITGAKSNKNEFADSLNGGDADNGQKPLSNRSISLPSYARTSSSSGLMLSNIAADRSSETHTEIHSGKSPVESNRPNTAGDRKSKVAPKPPPRTAKKRATSSNSKNNNDDPDPIQALINMDLSDFGVDDLRAHIETLCSELQEQRSKVQELSGKLAKVRQLRQQQVQDLAHKLDAEKASTADAVTRVVKLQAELQSYHLKYGPLE